ncbi:MAG: methyltransferase domain-containing protein [bacterium]|nr:methyltransferase domain-containing protein [bacterium]
MPFSDPSHTIAQFELQSGSHVADLGAGTGTLAITIARAVGEAGKVYAIEVQKPLLEKLKNHAKESRVHNIEALWGDIERLNGTHLKDRTVDAAVASNVLFQVEHKDGFVAEIKRILKPGGRVLVVDWRESYRGMGPHIDHVVTEVEAKRIFEQGGFTLVKKIDAGAHHYGLIFKKN